MIKVNIIAFPVGEGVGGSRRMRGDRINISPLRSVEMMVEWSVLASVEMTYPIKNSELIVGLIVISYILNRQIILNSAFLIPNYFVIPSAAEESQ